MYIIISLPCVQAPNIPILFLTYVHVFLALFVHHLLLLFPDHSSGFIYTWCAFPYILWDNPLLLQLQSENLCPILSRDTIINAVKRPLPVKGWSIFICCKHYNVPLHSVMANVGHGEQKHHSPAI